jgi:ABC-type transport system involved in multi-copper enzyme maturation permease subunit
MFITLFRRELREILSSFTFQSAMIVLTALILLSAYTQAVYHRSLVKDFEIRQRVHQVENNEEAIVVSRPVPTLLPFYNGAFASMPDEFRLRSESVSANPLSGDLTPLDWLLPKIDLSFIVGVLLSLVAIQLAHTTIAGEREQGTLKLILAGSVKRRTVLAAKMMSILVPISAALLYAVLLYTFIVIGFSEGTIALTPVTVAGLVGCLLASFPIIIVFVEIGVAVSTYVKRSSVALVSCAMIWAIAVLIWPSLVPYLASYLKPVPTWETLQHEKILKEGELIRDELIDHRRKADELKNNEIESTWSQYLELRNQWAHKRQEEVEGLIHRQNQRIHEQRRFATILASCSPYETFKETLGSLCGTGLDSYDRFLAAVIQYSQQEFLPASAESLSRKKPWLGPGPQDRRLSLRPFQTPPHSSSRDLAQAVWPFSRLLLEMLLLLAICVFNFERYDVR